MAFNIHLRVRWDGDENDNISLFLYFLKHNNNNKKRNAKIVCYYYWHDDGCWHIYVWVIYRWKATYVMQIMTSNLNMMIIVIIILWGFYSPSRSHRHRNSLIIASKRRNSCPVKLYLYKTIIIILAHHACEQKKRIINMKLACGHSSWLLFYYSILYQFLSLFVHMNFDSWCIFLVN